MLRHKLSLFIYNLDFEIGRRLELVVVSPVRHRENLGVGLCGGVNFQNFLFLPLVRVCVKFGFRSLQIL